MRLAAVLVAVLPFGLPAFAADPQLMNLVMPDAKVVAGLNVTSAKNSPLGQFLISRLPGDFASLKDTIGVDPLNDVTEVLAASPGADPANPKAKPLGLITMRGAFDPAKVTAALGAMKTPPQFTVSTYAGATLVTVSNAKTGEKSAIAFIGGTEAVAGDAATVTAALDRSSHNNAIDPSLAVLVNNLSGTEDAWLVTSQSPSALMPQQAASTAQGPAAQANQMLASVSAMSAGVKFGATVGLKLDLTATSPKNAEALANVVKFIASMATMNASQPGQNKQSAAVMEWLQNILVTTSGSAVDVALNIPEDQLEGLLGTAKKPAARPAKAN